MFFHILRLMFGPVQGLVDGPLVDYTPRDTCHSLVFCNETFSKSALAVFVQGMGACKYVFQGQNWER
jgi:hypothetical protein